MKSLNIIQESSDWLVIDKPAGISVHNDKVNVLSVLQQQKKNPNLTFHAVHRLDSETSGVFMIAKDPEVAAKLMEEMQKDSTHKLYQAILRGPMKEETALWDWKLSDKAEGRKNPQGLSKDRKECETLVKVLQKNEYLTLVECEILTAARQHQIRKHAAVAEHPVVGDKRYNDQKYNERIIKMYGTERLFLHATELRIRLNGRDMVFTSPLPGEFRNLMRGK
ncbi:MAG TPA: RNA pseudouridine synthase [Pseudobdellovibrionaceae bacterium]|jgi:tRNA pseudouridine65 synthase